MNAEVLKVLIIDDNPEDRAEVRRLLLTGSDRRYKFVEAETGAAGLRQLEDITCVVLDYCLPDMDASEVLAEMRGSREMTMVPVVVLTGTGGREMSSGVLRAGAMDYLGKAWMNPESITRAVENAVERFALQQELWKREDRLRESEHRLRLAMEASGTGMWDWDVTTNAVHWSPHCYNVFGLSDGQFAGTAAAFDRLVYPDDKERVWATVQTATERRTLYECEFRIVRSDGAVRWVSNLGRAMYTGDRPVRMIGTVTDITERKQAEEAMLEAQQRLRHWNMALEQAVNLKTAELVQSHERLRALATELNLAEQRERKRIATELHDHLQQTLVLGKLKLGTGKRLSEATPAVVKLIQETDAVFSDALSYTRTLVAELSPPVLREHGLGASLKWLGEYMKKYDLAVTVEVFDDPQRTLPEDQVILLFQSVRELLINSSKYAGTGKATVRMQHRAGDLCIVVSDAGDGFDLAAAAAAAGVPTGGISSKFGLFSIRERMRALGGSFEIESSPRQGTAATLMLPLRSSAALSEAISRQPSEVNFRSDHSVLRTQDFALREHPTIRVLLVDDHAMVRQGLRAILNGYTDIEVVGEAGSGEESVTAVERLRPRFVVMDINMSKMNGIEATRKITTLHPDITVIGLSVNVSAENQEAMKRAGAVRLMSKEAAVEQLHDAIIEAVGR